MEDKDILSKQQLKFNVGDMVIFKLENQKFVGIIQKRYIHSFLISFHSADPDIVDKYHNKTIISNKALKILKTAKQRKQEQENKVN